jgi:hypothetical protein
MADETHTDTCESLGKPLPVRTSRTTSCLVIASVSGFGGADITTKSCLRCGLQAKMECHSCSGKSKEEKEALGGAG